jgi:adenine-specific DNA-methyltransferase
MNSERSLIALAVKLGARSVAGWTPSEEDLATSPVSVSPADLAAVRREVRHGKDPLGDLFSSLRSAAERRPMGATYTPFELVDHMVDWAAMNVQPVRIVDPGVGSGRFLLRAAKRFPAAELIGIELDPLAAILARANLATAGLAARSRIILSDYRSARLPAAAGPTLYIGNPPYVRHHLISAEWKVWLCEGASSQGCRSSQLAGLHAYFFLATALQAKRGDHGIFVTAAEWLDVNYGCLVRDLFLRRLGGLGVLIVEPTAAAFPDAATTAAITSFQIEARPAKVGFRRIRVLTELGAQGKWQEVRRERLEAEPRWSHLSRSGGGMPSGHVELGELFRVHRGQVTGANKIWIAGDHSTELPPSVLFPSVTKARELLRAGLVLSDLSALRRVIDLPADLDSLSLDDRRRVERFLRSAKAAGANLGYIARNRRAWWSVGLRVPAPILATYMARRPPAFVRNLAEARHINIAHGLYPREALPSDTLDRVAKYLSGNTSVNSGRTYAGGLTKFEPREMERLPIPTPEHFATLMK